MYAYLFQIPSLTLRLLWILIPQRNVKFVYMGVDSGDMDINDGESQ